MEVTKTVYSLYYPETREVVDRLWSERPHHLYEKNYEKGQDGMHQGCLDGWRRWAGHAGVTLGDGFGHHYPTAGASEAISALMSFHATHGGGRVHVFEGEYEGYGYTAAALGLPLVRHPRTRQGWTGLAASLAPDDHVWLSQPSAIDGNLWASMDDFASLLGDSGALVVDLTYVGATSRGASIHLDHPAVGAVVWSISKPFGVYYHRIGGLLTRTEVPSLLGHHWFKNLFSLQLGERLLTTFAPGELPAKYRDRQLDALERAIAARSAPKEASPSDVVLLASAPRGGHEAFADYARGESLRFCLSPAMDAAINGSRRP